MRITPRSAGKTCMLLQIETRNLKQGSRIELINNEGKIVAKGVNDLQFAYLAPITGMPVTFTPIADCETYSYKASSINGDIHTLTPQYEQHISKGHQQAEITQHASDLFRGRLYYA